MWTVLFIIFVVFAIGGALGSIINDTKALPPDMYDPMFDYNHDGKQTDFEKFDQWEAWENQD